MSANVVGKGVLHVKHGRSAASRASLRESLLERSNSVAADRKWFHLSLHAGWPRGPEAIAEEFGGGTTQGHRETAPSHLKPLKPPITLSR